MMILDESGSSDGDSSCTLMYFPPIRDKGKFVGFPPRRKEKTPRVLQIGGNFEEVREGEIEDVMEVIKRSKVNLGLGGTNWARNSNAHGEGSSDGSAGGPRHGVLFGFQDSAKWAPNCSAMCMFEHGTGCQPGRSQSCAVQL